MNYWKAKYESIISLVEQRHVDAAESLVAKAIEFGTKTNISVIEALELMISATLKLKAMEDSDV